MTIRSIISKAVDFKIPCKANNVLKISVRYIKETTNCGSLSLVCLASIIQIGTVIFATVFIPTGIFFAAVVLVGVAVAVLATILAIATAIFQKVDDKLHSNKHHHEKNLSHSFKIEKCDEEDAGKVEEKIKKKYSQLKSNYKKMETEYRAVQLLLEQLGNDMGVLESPNSKMKEKEHYTSLEKEQEVVKKHGTRRNSLTPRKRELIEKLSRLALENIELRNKAESNKSTKRPVLPNLNLSSGNSQDEWHIIDAPSGSGDNTH